MSKRPWVVKNSRFIEDLLEEAVERINDLPPNTVAAVWSTVPVLLSRRHRKRDQLTREQELMQCESQIESIVKHTMNSLKGMRPKEIATITVGVAKVVQNIQQTKKERWSVDQQAFGNILMNDKSSQECILNPLAEAANNVLQDCDPCQLSDLAFAHALLRNDQKVHGVNTTLFGNIADASLDCINKFNLDELSNLVWAYATLNVPHTRLFQAVGNDVVCREDLQECYTPTLSNILWSFATLNIQHRALYHKLGDYFVSRNDLDNEFGPQEISNTVWSYVTANVQHPELFKKIGDHIATKQVSTSLMVWAYAHDNIPHDGEFMEIGSVIVAWKDLNSFTGYNLTNILWAYATAGVRHPDLFRIVGDAIAELFGDNVTEIENLKAFTTQELSNVLGAYAALNIQHNALFKNVGDHLEASSNLASFQSQEISRIVWAYSVTNNIDMHRRLFRKIGDNIAATGNVGSFKTRELTRIAWAFSVSGVDIPLLFNKKFTNILLERQDELKVEELCQLYQWHLWQTNEKSKHGLPKPLLTRCHQAFIASDVSSSDLRKDVMSELESMGLKPIQQYQTQSGYKLDALIEVNGKKIGVAVNGPSNYIDETPNGRTMLKLRQIRALDKIPIISVAYWEWDRRRKDRAKKQSYVNSLLRKLK
jgi:hypothetical protein